jgi:hypothetical protein
MKELPEVLIREWKREDLEPLVAQADNIKVWNNLRNYFPHPYTKENGQAWLDTVIGASPIVNLAIQADGELAGGIGLILNGEVSPC